MAGYCTMNESFNYPSPNWTLGRTSSWTGFGTYESGFYRSRYGRTSERVDGRHIHLVELKVEMLSDR
jgi:hypothetical protein